MFSEKELNLEETDLREQVALLSESQRRQYDGLVKAALKSPSTYALLNWFFLLGLHHFYLHRWLRGVINLALSLAGLYLIVVDDSRIYGGSLLLAIAIIEVPQLLNYEHLVHAFNIRVMRQCLKRARKSLP
ncbi:MAG: TM2 domain-containing protein [Gammaproteobacteria bacterium]|nr:TM2 domain-containing protein [Gammaproteobacteria bacterium]MDP2141852.1 TM2 domain-containing protein [Gammaproteobacteria bacterium]MDP2348343.1 TM2 domain-containing protein [Gammaproteobacteria bacterium]